MPALPQWLNIDPLASVPRMLQGYATGAQIGESLRQSEQRATEDANAAARFEAELQQRQAQAERSYQLHQEAEQEKAKMAARNMVGMQEYQALVASGLPKDKALMQAAPNLFYGHSDKLPTAIHELGLEEQARQNAQALKDYHESTLRQTASHNKFLEDKGTALQQDVNLIGKLKDDATRLRSEGNIPEAQKAEYQLSLIESKLLGPTETIETTTPEGNVTRVTRGGKPAGAGTDLTVASKTKLQEQMQAQDAPMATIDHISRNMQASDFGLAGQVGSFMDRYAAQIKPELADPRRMSVQNSVRTLRADFVKALKSDSNIAEAERKAIEKAIPSADTISQSAPLAVQMLVDAKKRFVEANRNAAKRLGTLPAPWAMSLEEIRDAYNSKKMPENEAVDAVKKYFPQTLEQ